MDVDNCPAPFACFSARHVCVHVPAATRDLTRTLSAHTHVFLGFVKLLCLCWCISCVAAERHTLLDNPSKASARLILQ